MPEDGLRRDIKVSPHVIDTLVKITHDNITLRERQMLANDVVHTLGGTSKITAMAIYGRDLNLANVLHLNANGDVLKVGLGGVGEGGDSETFRPDEAHSPTGVALRGGASKTKETLQPERLQIPLGLVDFKIGVQLMLLDGQERERAKLFIVKGTNAGTPAGDVGRDQSKMLTQLSFALEAFGGVPNTIMASNVREMFCHARFFAVSACSRQTVTAPIALRKSIHTKLRPAGGAEMRRSDKGEGAPSALWPHSRFNGLHHGSWHVELSPLVVYHLDADHPW